MTLLSHLTQNSLWHAFNALDDENTGRVSKSRLKVLTASLGNLLKCPNVEKGLQEHRSTRYLKFGDFIFYLQNELFLVLPKEISYKEFKKFHHDIEDICWLVSKCKFNVLENSLYPKEYFFKLFRIFCMIAEYQEPNELNNVVVSSSDVEFITDFYDKILNSDTSSSDTTISNDSNKYIFCDFTKLIIERYGEHYEKTAVVEATNEVYDIIVESIIKMGPLKKLIGSFGPWWEMWFILKQHILLWSTNKSQKDHYEELDLSNCKVKVESLKENQFSLSVGSKIIVLKAEDCKTKQQWIAAFKTAIKYSQSLEPYQRLCAAQKRYVRNLAKAKLEEEKLLLLQQKEVLEREKEAKRQLEQKLAEENEKLIEMKLREEELLMKLEEERRAKRDEEIVRNLQSRLLAEEWERRESLEQKQLRQEEELREERRRRRQLEQLQQEKEMIENQLMTTVTALQKEKAELYGTLKKTNTLFDGARKKILISKNENRLKRTVSADFSEITAGQWSLFN